MSQSLTERTEQGTNAGGTRYRNFRSLLSLAKTQRALAGQYRQWAREAEQNGSLESYRRYGDEARRLFRSAHFHLDWARQERDLANGGN